jgi:hypothetical protein
MTKTADHRRQTILEKQLAGWPRHLEGARQGNPWATLCGHCYGRHAPPNEEICPHDPPDISGSAKHDNRLKS